MPQPMDVAGFVAVAERRALPLLSLGLALISVSSVCRKRERRLRRMAALRVHALFNAKSRERRAAAVD